MAVVKVPTACRTVPLPERSAEEEAQEPKLDSSEATWTGGESS